MTNCNKGQFEFPSFKSRKINVDFKGGHVTGDAGILLLRQADKKIKLSADIARELTDPRRQASCSHSLLSLIRQRIYGICQGYEDLNDHDTLRHDIGFQTAVDRDELLAGASTLCRFENRVDRRSAVAISRIMVEKFIESFDRPPEELILDFDATDDPVHGEQEGRFFHGYYDEYCFLPLYVTCGSQLLVSYLRTSKIDPAKHSRAILSLLVKRFRKVWPGVKIIFRADSGFCRWRLMRWCDNHNVFYAIGMAKNTRVSGLAKDLMEEARRQYEKTRKKQRLFGEVTYGAKSWDKERRIIVKAEHGWLGRNPRYVVTNLDGEPQYLYEKIYCARGEMENRIKEQQLDLFADRTSCHQWWANQFRLLLSSLAYVLMESIRRLGLRGTELARSSCGSIRLKLLKIGATINRNTRQVGFHCSSGYPFQALFYLVAHRLGTG